ncbi:WYL domain-containing protein [Flavobacteriales bacterium]|nr:WYL domain-containing protein [Flavobacteriales bacterium]
MDLFHGFHAYLDACEGEDMPANKYALIRYRTIDRCLTNPGAPFPTKEELRTACEEALYGSEGDRISISTIEKDLNAMRNDGALGYYAPIIYHRDERGYHYEDEDFSIDNLQLNPEELESIRFAARTLVQFKNVPVFSQFGQAIGKIDDRLRMAPNLDTRNLDAVVQFESAPATRGSELLMPILENIQSKKMLRMSYKKFQSDRAKEVSLHPYLLKEYRNRWYVIGWNPERSAYRTYGLDRIQELHDTQESFSVRSDFNPDDFFLHSFGISKIAEAPCDVKIRCSQLEFEYLAAQPVHRSQRLTEIGPGSYELHLHVLLTFELIQFLLGLGSAVEVIEPKDLRQLMQHNLSNALDLYGEI